MGPAKTQLDFKALYLEDMDKVGCAFLEDMDKVGCTFLEDMDKV